MTSQDNVAEDRPFLAPGPRFVPRLHCPACRSDRTRTVFSCAFDEEPIAGLIATYYKRDPAILSAWRYELDHCLECGCVYQKYCGDEAFLTEVYSSWIGDEIGDPETYGLWVEILRAPWQSRDAQELLMTAAFLGRDLAGLKTFDYGMGYGLWPRIAAALGCDSHGFDLSPVCTDYARSKGVKIVSEPGEGQFDVINLEQVLEHVVEPCDTVVRLGAALKPGGLLKISVPRGDDILKRLEIGDWSAPVSSSRSLNPVLPLEHVNALTEQSLLRLGEAAGLEPVRIGIGDRFAFLRSVRTIPRSPRELAKALIRPWYRFHDPRNIYMWFRKDPQG
jgi:SAM-dependent methyltransferase